jgi:hypothetical protein
MMISSSDSAKALLNLLFEASGTLDTSVAVAQEACPEAEFLEYRRAIGNVLGDMWDQVIQPLLENHPHLTPEGLHKPDA